MRALALAAAGAAFIGAALLLRRDTATENQPLPGGGATPAPLNLGAAIGEVMDKITGAAPRGIRNNNPLNIRKGTSAWLGKTGNDGSFEIFDTPFNGIRAAGRLMKTYRDKYDAATVRSIVARWAPANENNVEAYINSVVKRSKLFPDMLLSDSEYPDMVAAMIYHENGQQPYDMNLIRQAVQNGLA